MNVEQIYWLREKLELAPDGRDRVMLEFSCDSGMDRTRRFFRVKDIDLLQAHSLYQQWGGIRSEGCRVGTTVRGPGRPAPRSIQLWRKNGNH